MKDVFYFKRIIMTKYNGRCPKCGEQREIKNPKAVQWPNDMWVAEGDCIACGTKIQKIIGENKPADL